MSLPKNNNMSVNEVPPVPVYRPTFITDGGQFRGSLIESPSNIFYQKVSASRATKNRLQFQWRSVADSLLLSPTVMLRMRLRITCPQVWNQLISALSVHGVKFEGHAAAANIMTAAANIGAGNPDQKKVPCLVFADGDAFSNICSSANLIFNGTSISLNRQNRFWRDWMRTQVACDDAARLYKSAGGAYDKYDQRAVVVQGGACAGALTNRRVGCTQDSGINERSKNLYAMSTTGQQINGFEREIQISYPVPLPPFNPWRGTALPASCPYKSCPMAIPHLSSGSLDFLLEDFDKAFLRRLGDARAGVAEATVASNSSYDPVTMEIVEGQTYIELKYFRLSHARNLRESYKLAIWQAQTFLGEAPPNQAVADKGFQQYGDLVAMIPVGKTM